MGNRISDPKAEARFNELGLQNAPEAITKAENNFTYKAPDAVGVNEKGAYVMDSAAKQALDKILAQQGEEVGFVAGEVATATVAPEPCC